MARTLPLLALPVLGACLAEPDWEVTRDRTALTPLVETCHAEAVTPATLETVTERVVVIPAMTLPDGTVLRESRYITQSRTEIVEPRIVTRVQSPCALQARDPDFVMQVQRALAVRGLYDGPISGFYDTPTRAAVAAYQETLGLMGEELSTEAALTLGLVALRPEG